MLKRFTYEELCNIDYRDVVNTPCRIDEHTNAFFSAGDLHMGLCDIFAKALHDRFGYDNYEIKEPPFYHVFCGTTRNNEQVFIDASGASLDYRDLIPWNQERRLDTAGKELWKLERIGASDLNLTDEYLDAGIEFASNLIQMYEEYYSVHQSRRSHLQRVGNRGSRCDVAAAK